MMPFLSLKFYPLYPPYCSYVHNSHGQMFQSRKNGTRTKHLPGQNITPDKISTFANLDKISTFKNLDKISTWQKHQPLISLRYWSFILHDWKITTQWIRSYVWFQWNCEYDVFKKELKYRFFQIKMIQWEQLK